MTASTRMSTRSLKVLPLSAMVTGGLFILMITMVSLNDRSANYFTGLAIDIFQKPQQLINTYKPPAQPKPPEPEIIPRPETPITEALDNQLPKAPAIDNQSPMQATNRFSPGDISITGRIGNGFQSGNSAAIPEVHVMPRYPEEAIRKGLEGYVDVIFDITEQGATDNIRIAASDPKRIFDRDALNAVRKWRYKPRYIDGKAVRSIGATSRVTFVLDKK